MRVGADGAKNPSELDYSADQPFAATCLVVGEEEETTAARRVEVLALLKEAMRRAQRNDSRKDKGDMCVICIRTVHVFVEYSFQSPTGNYRFNDAQNNAYFRCASATEVIRELRTSLIHRSEIPFDKAIQVRVTGHSPGSTSTLFFLFPGHSVRFPKF